MFEDIHAQVRMFQALGSLPNVASAFHLCIKYPRTVHVPLTLSLVLKRNT